MRTVVEHRRAALALVAPLPSERVPLDAAEGRVLAGDVRADAALPRWDNSAMDGYAVRAEDVAGAPDGPVVLRVLADLPAGSDAEPDVVPGTAARIMTGAPLPPGADSIVPVEATDGGTDTVRIDVPPRRGAHVRRAGEDVGAGDLVLPAGTLLGAPQIAAAASVGAGDLLVHRAPRVAVLSTGSELVPPGQPLRRGQIPDSNSFGLAAAVRAAGGRALRVGAVPDDVDVLRRVLTDWDGAAPDDRPDLVLTSGGVSMGAFDVVKELLADHAGMEFVSVAMQPGKPQGLGRLPGGTPVVAVPGNPVSALVSFHVFVVPLLRRLRGLADPDPDAERETAVVADGWRTPPAREQYMPVTLTRGVHGAAGGAGLVARRAVPGGSGSHLVAGLARAHGLAVVAADVEEVRPADVLPVLRLGRG
ncbi:molybdopterin molybdotransferase MoeA [Cellulomonas aerilata]|uniref:Molybdopterin molybdenumtransferase n=1 Tax=Cellulomonas aerilata TaxID=515326 RepID=A0A512D7W1_9CELL|nr:gephyrin-like molybdotransferase Glp [Cellulomonas aerilata]GEO32566.1 putative molybdopterin biosynthesis protein MoeA [Cellulomonas aerilata]